MYLMSFCAAMGDASQETIIVMAVITVEIVVMNCSAVSTCIHLHTGTSHYQKSHPL